MTLSVLRSSSLKSPLFGLIHRLSFPVIVRGGESFRVLRLILVVRSVMGVGMTLRSLESPVFEIDISGILQQYAKLDNNMFCFR